MILGKRKSLALFLEKDNLKMLVYHGKTRVFAGQITFAPEVVHDGFIADSAKYDNQVRMAFAQKEILREPSETILFLSPDKAFTKTLAATDSLDAFVSGLPYFREELSISSEAHGDKITYTAFEKKLVEDAQRPFLELGKKTVGVKSGAVLLTSAYKQPGHYLMLIPLEKEIAIVVASDGEVVEVAAFRNEVFSARIGEFLASHNLTELRQAYTLGVFPKQLADKLNMDNHLNLSPLATTDIYDLIVTLIQPQKLEFKLPSFNKKYLLLIATIFIGSVLVYVVIKNIGQAEKKQMATPVAPPSVVAPPVEPEPKPGDYKVEVLNGTLVAGEAGKLAAALKELGFDVTGTKNATTASFVATRLRVTDKVPEKITAELKTELLKTYQSVNLEKIATSTGTALIQIIIGKKK